MESVHLVRERLPWWWALVTRPSTRPGTIKCTLERRVKRPGHNWPNEFEVLAASRGKRNYELCGHKKYPFVGRASDGTWCCYANSDEALTADPHYEAHTKNMAARFKEYKEAVKRKNENYEYVSKTKCSDGLVERICHPSGGGASGGCCPGSGYPCLDEATGACYALGENLGSEMQIPSRNGSSKPPLLPPRIKRRRTDARQVTFA